MQADIPTQSSDTETAAAVRAVYAAETERRARRNRLAWIWGGVAVIVAAAGFFIWQTHADNVAAKQHQRDVNCNLFGYDC